VDRPEPATILNLTAVVTPDDDWFMARRIEVPVVSQGPTVDEGGAGQRQPELDDQPPAFGAPAQPPLQIPASSHEWPHDRGGCSRRGPERREFVIQGLALVVLILDSREGFEWSARGLRSGR
jgi:hypothetical protein